MTTAEKLGYSSIHIALHWSIATLVLFRPVDDCTPLRTSDGLRQSRHRRIPPTGEARFHRVDRRSRWRGVVSPFHSARRNFMAHATTDSDNDLAIR